MLPTLFTRRFGTPLASRWGFDPFADLDRIANACTLDRSTLSVRVDIREDGENFYIDADLPGFTGEDVEVTCENGLLTISGERTAETAHEGHNFRRTERRMGRFTRSFRLSDGVNEDSVEALMKDGVLTVRIAKTEEVKPRKIDVKRS